MKRSEAFETADLSHLALPLDEPLSLPVIMAHAALAQAVIDRALEDVTNKDELIRRQAIRFCLGQDKEDREDRGFWLSWLDQDDHKLAHDARKRLNAAASSSAGTPRQRRVLPKGEALPLRRSRPSQPEGLSYRA